MMTGSLHIHKCYTISHTDTLVQRKLLCELYARTDCSFQHLATSGDTSIFLTIKITMKYNKKLMSSAIPSPKAPLLIKNQLNKTSYAPQNIFALKLIHMRPVAAHEVTTGD